MLRERLEPIGNNHALERICKQAGLSPIQWHGPRHTFASHLVMKGVPLKAAQELLGNETQAMTERNFGGGRIRELRFPNKPCSPAIKVFQVYIDFQISDF
jgi:integrase